MIENFIYNDVVLYCKGWLYKDGNMIDDLSYLFYQIYGWEAKTEAEVANFMLRAIGRLYAEMAIGFDDEHHGRFNNSFASFYDEIKNRQRLYDVSLDMATILWARSIFQSLSKDEIKLNKPHYGKKEHFRMGSLFGSCPKSMTYTEMNRQASKMFDKY